MLGTEDPALHRLSVEDVYRMVDVRIQDLLLVEGGFVLPDLIVVERLGRDRHPTTVALAELLGPR